MRVESSLESLTMGLKQFDALMVLLTMGRVINSYCALHMLNFLKRTVLKLFSISMIPSIWININDGDGGALSIR